MRYLLILLVISGNLYAQKITRDYMFGTFWTFDLPEIQHASVYNKKLIGKWQVVSSKILRLDEAGDTVQYVTNKGNWGGLKAIQFNKDRTVIFSGDSTFEIPAFQIYWAFTSDSIKVYTPVARSGKEPTEWEYQKLTPTVIRLYNFTKPGIVTIGRDMGIKKLARKTLVLGNKELTVTLEKAK